MATRSSGARGARPSSPARGAGTGKPRERPPARGAATGARERPGRGAPEGGRPPRTREAFAGRPPSRAGLIDGQVARILREGVTSRSRAWIEGQLMAHDMSPAELAAALYQLLESPLRRTAERPAGGARREWSASEGGARPPRSASEGRGRAARPADGAARRVADGPARRSNDGAARRPAGPRPARPGRDGGPAVGGQRPPTRRAREDQASEAPARPRVKGGPSARRVAATTPARGPRNERPGGITGFSRRGRSPTD
jgi:hypothetical protein